jgi:hypothetical protein
MKKVAFAIVVLCFSVSLAAQSGNKRSHGGTTPVATSLAAPAGLPDVNTALVDLDRVSQATQSDIAGVHVDKWKSGWRTAFLKRHVRKQQAENAAAALQKNLTDAMPGLIQDVQNSHASVSSTFKLYDNLSVVCELLDSLVSATESYGKKDEYGPLADDLSALIRIRRDISSYVQQAAASVETKGKLPYAAASTPAAAPGRLPKKIVVDDTIPEKKPAKKKPEMLSNVD